MTRYIVIMSAVLTLASCVATSPEPTTSGDEVPRGVPLLLSFLDPTAGSSRSQITVLRSIGTQYGAELTVAIVDVTGKADLTNLRHDWNFDAARVILLDPADPAATARTYDASVPPTTLLIAADGRIRRRWTATVAPVQDIALLVQDLPTANPTK